MKSCPECKKQLATNALVCGKCQHRFPTPATKLLKNIFVYGPIAVLVIGILALIF